MAAELGCEHVCLFTQAISPSLPSVGDADVPALAAAMADAGVSAYGVTSFVVGGPIPLADLERGLARGQQLGAQYASVRIEEPDEARAAEGFAGLAELAARHGLVASIEFVGYGNPELLPRTLRIIEAAGAGALSIDPTHIVRSGASLDLLRRVSPARIGYVQLCDGPAEAPESAYMNEMRYERLPPGEGAFPLAEILSVVPAGRAVSLEVPQASLADASAIDRCRRAVEATRRFLAATEPD
ncbi:MAG: sugar phosphate isomerase/epimerase [Novosphingobium sp.]|nr:sugar phosphate isomerase/epimerase [Novosphingobium sp.]